MSEPKTSAPDAEAPETETSAPEAKASEATTSVSEAKAAAATTSVSEAKASAATGSSVSIPKAVASGLDAKTPGAIAPVRAGIVAGVVAAVFVFVSFLVAEVPDRALSLVGADGSEYGRHGGMRIAWVPPEGANLAQVERTFLVRHQGGRVSIEDGALVVEVGGVPPEEVERASKLLSAGGLSFHRTVITKAMPELAGYGFEIGAEVAGVRLEIDQWTPDEGGERRTDYYLLGNTREDIAAALEGARAKGWKLPDGTRIAYEYLDWWAEQKPHWRTHVIETASSMGGERVADAVASYDPNTNRPIVLLDFDREGARIFGELTASMVGLKLATVVGGDVKSAPIINGPIRGGRASITMGGGDARQQERERDALVGVLKSGQLPAGGTLREAIYIAPTVTSTHMMLARLLLALGAGVLVGLLAWALVRTTHPVWRRPETRLPGRIAWERLGVLLLLPLVLVGGSHVTAPGLDSEQLLFAVGDDSQFSLTMLGLGPLMTSYFLVELVATIVPRWRRRRHAGAAARLPFDLAVLVLACVLSVLQSHFAIAYLESADASPLGLDRLLFFASMVAATLAFAGIAALVRRFGVGSGLVTIIAVSEAIVLFHYFMGDPAIAMGDTNAKPVIAVALLAYAIVMIAALRIRISRAGEAPLRIPTSGEAPIYGATGMLVALISFATLVGAHGLVERMNDVYFLSYSAGIWLVIGFLVTFTVLWSWAFARPAALRPYAERAGLGAPSLRTWRAATLLSAGLLLALLAGHWVLYERAGTMEGVARAMLLAAVLLDVFDDLRGRRGKTERAWSLHSAQHADIAGHALAAAGIAYHLTGANVRTLLAWFGPYAPIDVHVRTEDAARAREVLANVFAAK